MPNLVVYVPAKLWKRLEDELGAEWPTWAREATVKHIEEMLNGGTPAPAVSAKRAASAMTELVEAAPDYDSFKPDFKKGTKPTAPPADPSNVVGVPSRNDDHFKPDPKKGR